ncbi:probable serine/threonine-protein kinase clkA [Teleopsis dalmanni]|uniref:probable serine/threonine-protein kinase clkA n=1 Tax=Teleopsis dalmanni TaxID=139649 RepID=UPI0018CE8595|nr:probable serine/threonine-protein kinase clkA [Teleopsis dalmanni]
MADHHHAHCSKNCSNRHCDSSSEHDIRPQDSGRNIEEISDGVLQNFGDLREFYKQLQHFVDLTQELFRNCSDNSQSDSPSIDSIPQGNGNISPSYHHNCPHRRLNSTERGQAPQKYYDTEKSHRRPCSEQYDSRSITSGMSNSIQLPKQQKDSSQKFVSADCTRYKNKSATCELSQNTENQITRRDNCSIKGNRDKSSKYPEKSDDCERPYESNNIQRKTQYHNGKNQKENNSNKSCTCSQCQDSKNMSNKINIFMEFSSDDECNDDDSSSTNQFQNSCPMQNKTKQMFAQDTNMSTERNCIHNKIFNNENYPLETLHKLRSERYNNSANNCMSNTQQFPKSSKLSAQDMNLKQTNYTKCTHKSSTDKSNGFTRSVENREQVHNSMREFQGKCSQYPEENEDSESLDQDNSNRSNAQDDDALNQGENNRYKSCSCARCQNKNINKNNISKEVSSDEEGDNDDLTDYMYEAIPVKTPMPPNKTENGCSKLDKNTQTSEHCSIMNTKNNCRFNKESKEKSFPTCNHQKLCSHRNNNHRSSNNCMSNMPQLKPKNTEYIPCRNKSMSEYQGNREQHCNSMRENYNKGSQYPERIEECESSSHIFNNHSNPKYCNTPKQGENNKPGSCRCAHCQHLTDASRQNKISTEFSSDDDYEDDDSSDYGCNVKHLAPVKTNECPTSNRNTHKCTHSISVSRGHNCVTNKRVSSCTQDTDWKKENNQVDQAKLYNKSDCTKEIDSDIFDPNAKFKIQVIDASETQNSQPKPQTLKNAGNNSCSTKQSSKDCSCNSSEPNANGSSTRDQSRNDQSQKETSNAEPNQTQDGEEDDGETKYKRSFVVKHNSLQSEPRKSETKPKSPRPSLLNRLRNSKGNTNSDAEDNK